MYIMCECVFVIVSIVTGSKREFTEGVSSVGVNVIFYVYRLGVVNLLPDVW